MPSIKHKAETVDEWCARYLAYRRSLGQYALPYAWRAWISPRIGHLPWTRVSPRLVEQIRDDLDAAIRVRLEEGPGRHRLLARSALDVWHVLTAACRTARRSKRRELRALDGKPNPCADVEPPGEQGTRGARRKPFLYPTEFAALMRCKRVPLERRRLYVLSAYTYMRPGELGVLRHLDVDIKHRIISVARSWDFLNETPKEGTKTPSGVRYVPIEPSLLPLLRAVRVGAAIDDVLAPLIFATHRKTLSATLRADLLVAGIVRPELHASTNSTMCAVFRTLRDTGITWLAMAGVPITQIARRAGHVDLKTTNRYIKMAEDLTGKLGKPFPALPPELVGGRRK